MEEGNKENHEGVDETKEEEKEDDEQNKEEAKVLEENVATKTKGSDKKGDKNAKKKNKKRTFKDSGGKKGRVHVDVLGEDAMTNALYICHSVQELLFWRGYQWAPGGKKPKKGKK